MAFGRTSKVRNQFVGVLLSLPMTSGLGGAAELSQDEIEKAVAADSVKIRGTYVYLDGDRFVYDCGGSLCADVLARDQFLQDNVLSLHRRQITIVVRREVCSATAFNAWCWRSGNGTYFRIIHWIDPKPAQTH